MPKASLLVIVLFTVLFTFSSCSSNHYVDDNVLVTYNDRFTSLPGDSPEKRDSILKSALQKDSFILILEGGFNKVTVNLHIGNKIDTTFLATTSWILGKAADFILPKPNTYFRLRINNNDYKIPMSKKHVCLLINFDTTNKRLYADYVNDVPGYR